MAKDGLKFDSANYELQKQLGKHNGSNAGASAEENKWSSSNKIWILNYLFLSNSFLTLFLKLLKFSKPNLSKANI